MNIEDYILSGILEAYALGDLSAAERTAVEKDLVQYPELRAELAKIEEAQEQLLMKAAIRPRASVKADLLSKIEGNKSEARIVVMPSPVWKYAAAASIAIAFVASYLAYEYYGRWKASEENLTALIAQNRQIAQDYNTVNQRLDKMQGDMHVIGSPDFKRVMMNGTANAPDSKAYVYWNDKTREVYLHIENMKTLAHENQYQLWAMIDGKPVDAGVFDMNSNGLQRMKDMAGAGAFAVTIEPRGGRSTPTLSQLQMLGEVVKG
ncbi:MAG: anti-sigma factor [Cyclobacteriaceae bacterium]|nr:anti-sigma factor [Cyclobacteriaceae bacterium]